MFLDNLNLPEYTTAAKLTEDEIAVLEMLSEKEPYRPYFNLGSRTVVWNKVDSPAAALLLEKGYLISNVQGDRFRLSLKGIDFQIEYIRKQCID